VTRALVLRGVSAGMLFLLALVLAATAHDVFGWSGQNERADVAVAHFSRDPEIWQPGTWLPSTVSRILVGTSDDVRFDRALQQVQLLRGKGTQEPYNPPALNLAQAELTFDRIAHSHARADVRARAAELHGILYFQQVLLQGAASGDGGLAALERAIADLQDAVRLDPSNGEAAYNLEWLLDSYRPVAVERAGQLSVRQARRGDTAGGGGSPGLTAVAGGF
jgi:hypothetical protein